jgi:hypothetical protein
VPGEKDAIGEGMYVLTALAVTRRRTSPPGRLFAATGCGSAFGGAITDRTSSEESVLKLSAIPSSTASANTPSFAHSLLHDLIYASNERENLARFFPPESSANVAENVEHVLRHCDDSVF